MSSGKPAAVFSLQLEADSFLLGSDDVLPGSRLLLVELLVQICGVGRALCLDEVGENDGKTNSNIEIVLHHKVFLGCKEGGDTEEGHVGAGHTSLGVEGIEPFSRENECLHGSPLNWPLSGREVDKIPLSKGWCGGQLSGPREATGHHGRSDSKPGEHDDGGGEQGDEDACLALGGARAALPD